MITPILPATTGPRSIRRTGRSGFPAPGGFMNAIATLAGRFGLAALFVLAGLGKLGAGYAGTQAYMEATGVPGALLPLVILAEIGGGLALAAGLLTRWA